MKIQKVLLILSILLGVVGTTTAVLKGNSYAASGWLFGTVMAGISLSQLAIQMGLVEDNRFWKRQFTNAQERYARTVPALDEPETPKEDACGNKGQ